MKARLKIVQATAIFLILQAVSWYYLIAMNFFVFNAGPKPPRFYLLPGIDYIIKVYFPLFSNSLAVYYAPPGIAVLRAVNEGFTFLNLFQLGLMILIVMSFSLYVPTIARLWRANTKLNSRKGMLIWNTTTFLILQFIYWYIYFRMWLSGYYLTVNSHGFGSMTNEIFLSVLVIVIGGTFIIYFLKVLKLRKAQPKTSRPLNSSQE